MIVSAVVLCAARPDPVATIGDEPMVAWAVRCLLDSGLVEQVDVLVPGDHSGAVARACRGLPVSVHAALAPDRVGTHSDQRAGPRSGDVPIAKRVGGIVVLHDADRPLAPPELASSVVAAVRSGHRVAVPALPMTDTVKQVDGAGLVAATPDRSTLRVVQTPMALRAELLTDPPARTLTRLLESGVAVHTVPGHPLAFPVRSAWDLELARLLAEQGSCGRGNGG